MGRELQRISGVDLTRIDGIDVRVAQTVISEVGVDMTRWKTEAHFASWLGLCPDNRITGGKVIRKGTREERHRQQQVDLLKKRAAKLNLQLVESLDPA